MTLNQYADSSITFLNNEDGYPPWTATGSWSCGVSGIGSGYNTFGQSFMTPNDVDVFLTQFTYYVGGVPVGLQATPFVSEYNPTTNNLVGDAIWTGEPFTMDTYGQPYPIYKALTVNVPGGVALDPTKVYAAFFTTLEPDFAAWPGADPCPATLGGIGVMNVDPPLPAFATIPQGRGALASGSMTLAGLQDPDTFIAHFEGNGMATYMTFARRTELTISTKKESVRTVAGRVVKIRYTITNPSDAYIADQEFQVVSTGCARTWALPVSLAAGKKMVITIVYKADKCSTSTGTTLASSILGTAVTGPDVEINIKPAAFLPKYCDGHVAGGSNKIKYM